MAATGEISTPEPALHRADSAVGVASPAPLHWFAAIVKNRSESKISDDLAKAGIETFVPVQNVARRQRNGKTKLVPHVVIPAMLFVHCTEVRRKKEVVWHPLVHRFLTNRAASEARTVARISDHEIRTLRFMLGQSDIPIGFLDAEEGYRYKASDHVTVVRGSLKGLEGEVVEVKSNETQLIVRLSTLGCATLTISTSDLAPVNLPGPPRSAS